MFVSQREIVRDRSWRMVAMGIVGLVLAVGVGFGLGGVAGTASAPSEPTSFSTNTLAPQPVRNRSSVMPSQSEIDLVRGLTIAYVMRAAKECEAGSWRWSPTS
jgi:hypothetical protein